MEMAARIIKVAALAVLAAALSAPLASAKPIDEPGSISTAATYLNTPASDQGMQQGTVAAPNDRAGEQGVGQTSADPIGMGGQYGQNLIQNAQASKKRDLQNAKSFTLPTSPDRPGTSSVTPALSIPYLSHGVGVDAAQFNGSSARPDDRSGTRGVEPSTPTAVAAPVSSTGDGFNWGTAGIGAGGFAALALAIALLTVVMRRGRSTDVAVS
jgi:hypothetical protein